MRINIYIIIFVFTLQGCRSKEKKIIKQKDFIIETFIDDSGNMYDTVKYYSYSNNLIRKDFIKCGEIEGASYDYFNNGSVKSVINYSQGKKYGLTSYYDSSGRLKYRDNYYFDILVGPIVYYDTSTRPKSYYFVNFENQNIFYIDYSKDSLINQIINNCITYTLQEQLSDSLEEASVFLFLPNPPKFKIAYSVYFSDRNSKNKLFKEIYSSVPFISFNIPLFDKERVYYIGANLYDSMTSKSYFIKKKIQFDNK